MSSLMRFEVLAPDKYVLKSDAISYVEAVTLWGGVGILPRHAPLIAALKSSAEVPRCRGHCSFPVHTGWLYGG